MDGYVNGNERCVRDKMRERLRDIILVSLGVLFSSPAIVVCTQIKSADNEYRLRSTVPPPSLPLATPAYYKTKATHAPTTGVR